VLSLMLEICRKMRELDAESDNYKWMHIDQPSPCRRGPVATPPRRACDVPSNGSGTASRGRLIMSGPHFSRPFAAAPCPTCSPI
jgi:hypothetical protein